MKFHTPISFIKYAPREWTTWIGIWGILFYIGFYKDINFLFSGIFRYHGAPKIVWDFIGTITIPSILSLLVLIRGDSKKDDTQ